MIVATQTPLQGAIILDTNNTVIKVQSSNGAGYYYRAFITVDGTLFDVQGWSRENDYTASYDLKKLYSAYFTPVFLAEFENKLEAQTHLIKEIEITVKEYAIENDVEVQSLALPTFFIMYNIKPERFNYTDPVVLLGMGDVTMVVPKDGKVCFPFYVGAANNLQVTLTDSNDVELDTRAIDITKGGVVFLYQFDLAPVALGYNVLFVKAQISLNDAPAISVTYRINRLPDYPIKEIAYLNNFGYYCYAYPDGEMQQSNGLSIETYTHQDNTERVYEINEEVTYTINSGSLRAKERGIMNLVATSPDTRLKNGAGWLPVVTNTKKILVFKDRVHQYEEALVFTRRTGTDIENEAYSYDELVLPNIEIITLSNNGYNTINLAYRFNNGYTAAMLSLRYRNINGGNTYTAHFNATAPTGTASINVNVTPGAYTFYLQDDANTSEISNTKNAPIV